MRSILLGVSSIVVAAVAAFACSSSEIPADDGDDTEVDSGTRPPPVDQGSSGDPGTSSGSSGNVPTDAAADTGGGGGSFDGGTPIDGGNAGTKCLSGSVLETEDNNTADTADVLPNTTTSFCGRISATGDEDFATFTYPADKNSIGWGFSYTAGTLAFTITADGVPVDKNAAPQKGKKYVVKVASTGGSVPSDFRLEVGIN